MSKIGSICGYSGRLQYRSKAEGTIKRAMESYRRHAETGIPQHRLLSADHLFLLGIKVEKLDDALKVMDICKKLLAAARQGKTSYCLTWDPCWTPVWPPCSPKKSCEAIRYVEDPDFYYVSEETDPENGKIWLGAAEDTVFRKRGVEFVDGTAPGFAAIVGAAPTPEIAKEIAEEYQKKNLYVFMCANQNGTTFSEQLVEAGVQIGWNTRLVPFGPDISAAVFALGFANRAAMAFGGIKPGDFKKILLYNKDRIFAFVNALGDVNAEWAANAAGCVNWGFPTIADTDIPEILPYGVCTYEHVVGNVPHDQMTQKSIEIRGLKVTVSNIDIPLAYGPAFEGERVRKDDLYLEMGGGKTQATELVEMKDMNEIEDGKVTVIGPEISDMKKGDTAASGHLRGSCRPRNAGRFRAHPGTADSPPDQLRPGRHAHRAARHRLDPHRRTGSGKRLQACTISEPSCTPNSIRTSAPFWTKSR